MKRMLAIGWLLLFAAAADAQEPPVKIAADPHAVIGGIMQTAPLRIPDRQWFREAFDPTLREQREIRRMLAERNTVSVKRNTGRISLGNKEHGAVKVIGLSIGNTAMDNFSPFPDRLLDARTLRFPMPRK